MDYHDICYRCLWSPEDNPGGLLCSLDFSMLNITRSVLVWNIGTPTKTVLFFSHFLWALPSHARFIIIFHCFVLGGTFMFRFHIIIIIVYFAVPAPQNSRRLTGNWREVAIYTHFYEKADGFDATSSCIYLLFIFVMKEFLCTCLFCAFQRTSAFVC